MPNKVLIVGQPFNRNTGGGVTLSNLFYGWEKSKLAVVCSGYLLIDDIDTKPCNRYYQLGHKEHKWKFPFSWLKRKYYSGDIDFDGIHPSQVRNTKPATRKWLILKLFYPILEFLGLYNWASTLDLSEDLCDWLDHFNPDVIYAQANSLAEINFCISIQSYLKKPMVFHMMDDWLSLLPKRSLFRNFWKRKIDRDFRRLLDKSSTLLSISDLMSEEYKDRYSREFIPFHNPVDFAFWKEHQRNSYEFGAKVTLLYAGRIGVGIDSSLKTISKAIKLTNEKTNLSIQFIIQSADEPGWIRKYDFVHHRPLVPYSHLPKVFAEADLLILPYDFSDKALRFIKYSMPTKASEYMICGTPIIIFAPAETALTKFAKEHDCAEIVTENSARKLSEALGKLIKTEAYRRTIAQNGKDVAARKFDIDLVSEDFRTLLLSVADKPIVP